MSRSSESDGSPAGQPQLPERMRAVLLTGHGGVDRLDYREDVRDRGARRRSSRGAGPESIDIVVDVVGGPSLPTLLELLRCGGSLVSAGLSPAPSWSSI